MLRHLVVDASNEVPHGVVHRNLYQSTIVGDNCPFLVYTPPGYDPAGKESYPVLYLLHGYSDAEVSDLVEYLKSL